MSELFCYFEKDGVKYEVFLTRSIRARKIIFTFKKGALYVYIPCIYAHIYTYIGDGICEESAVDTYRPHEGFYSSGDNWPEISIR